MSDLIKREDAIKAVMMADNGEIPYAIVADIIKGIPSVKENDNDTSVKYARQRQGASSNRPLKGI